MAKGEKKATSENAWNRVGTDTLGITHALASHPSVTGGLPLSLSVLATATVCNASWLLNLGTEFLDDVVPSSFGKEGTRVRTYPS